MIYYKQCELYNIRAEVTHTAYIPEEFAHIGKMIKIKREGKWEDGWQVMMVHTRMEQAYVEDHSLDYLRTRKASDI